MLTKSLKPTIVIILLYLLNVNVSATEVDSSWISQLEFKAKVSLRLTIEHNRQIVKTGSKEKLNFVIEIDDTPLPVGDSSVFQRAVTDPPFSFINTEKHAELNSYLNRVYQQEQIACYIVFINYFNYKLSIRLSDDETITNIIAYQRKFAEVQKNKLEDPTVEELKRIHEKVSDDVYQGITKDHPFVFMDVAAYCTSGGAGLMCDYYGKHYYFGLSNNPKLPHLRDLIKKKFNGQYAQFTDKQIIAEDQVHGLAAAVIQAGIKSKILTTTDKDVLCSILNESDFPFNGLTFISTAYASLTVEERIHAIKIFLTDRVGGTWSVCNAEQKLISIIKNTPPEQIDNLLLKLEQDKLVNELISAIDDFGPGGNNYEALLKTFSELVLKSPTFEQRFAEYQNASLASSRSFFWDKSYFLSLAQTPVGNNKYSIELLEDQQIKIFHSYVKEWRLTGYQAKSEIPLYEEVWESDPNPVTLHPFDLVLFIDNSRLGLIDGSTVGGELGMAIMPAIFLKYAHDKKFNANTLKTIAVAVDLATLVSGPGVIAKVFQAGNRIRQAWVIADVVNSGLNLTINLSDGNLDPRFQSAVNLYNGLMGTIGVTKIAKNGIVKAADILNQLGNFVGSLSKQAVKDYLTAITALRLQLKDANFDIVNYCKDNKSAESIFAMEDQLRKEWQLRFPNESLPLPANFYLNVSEELQNVVRTKIPSKAEELLDVLNVNSELRQAMTIDQELITTWSQVTKTTFLSLKNNLNFLKEFKGYIQRSGAAFAGHYENTFELYLKGKNTGSWGELYDYVNTNKLNGFLVRGILVYWPPNNGGYNTIKRFPRQGDVWDRYHLDLNKRGGEFEYSGEYCSPIENNSPYPFINRGLWGNREYYQGYYKIEILEDLDFEVEIADVIPWHGNLGGAKQIKLPENNSIQKLLLKYPNKIRMTFIESPSGKY